MVFWEKTYKELWKNLAEKILDRYKIDSNTTKRAIIYTDNIYKARNDGECFLRVESVYNIMKAMKECGL